MPNIQSLQKELQVQFEELQKKEKDALDQMEKINAVRNQIREELLRLQGEYRGLEKFRIKEEGAGVESTTCNSDEANGGSAKVVGHIGAGKSG